MNTFKITLTEISSLLNQNNIKFLITRCDVSKQQSPDDIDLLVEKADFYKLIKLFQQHGYDILSHDQALGGRIKGMQINLVKSGRTKIDLHQEFSWRASKYLDLNLLWGNQVKGEINGVQVPIPAMKVDAFLVLVNIIFEKTYFQIQDFDYVKRMAKEIFHEQIFKEQTKKYHWNKTFSNFQRWINLIEQPKSYPVFLPMSLVLYSYWEKLLGDHAIDIISFIYYFFFWTRYKITKTLPYE